MRADGISDIRAPQTYAAPRSTGNENSSLPAESTATPVKSLSSRAVEPVATRPRISGSTLAVTASIAANSESPPGSAAYTAREVIAQNPRLAGLPFGRVVSAISRGIDPTSLLSEIVEQEVPTVPEGAVVAPSDASGRPVTLALAGNVSPADMRLLQNLYA